MRYLQDYLLDCQLRGLAPMTQISYKRFILEFFAVTEFPGNLTALFEFLRARYLNPRTRHDGFRAIRTFVRWCARQGFCTDWISGARLACAEAPQPPPLTREEVERIFASIPHTLVGLRDRAFYATCYYSLQRRDTIRLLRRSDVNLADRWLTVKTKGGKEAILSLPRSGALLLHAWMMRNPSQLWVFPSLTHPDRPMDAHVLSRRLAVYAHKAGFSPERRIFLHLLRHSGAGELARRQVSLSVIQAALLHSDIKTTQRYVHRLIAQSQVREILDEIFH